MNPPDGYPYAIGYYSPQGDFIPFAFFKINLDLHELLEILNGKRKVLKFVTRKWIDGKWVRMYE